MKTKDGLKLSYALIPTEDATPLCIYQNELMWLPTMSKRLNNETYRNQHIYLCSGLPIKEEDWVYSKDNNIIFKANKRTLEKLDKGNSSVLKIEFTTDQKLFEKWVRHDGMEEIGKFITGVKEIDSNTEAWIEQKSFPEVRTVPFLQTFVTLYNKKYNKKEVDVDELANELTEKYYGKKLSEITHEIEELEADHYRSGIIVGYNEALQSQAAGFSLEDIRKAMTLVADKIHKDLSCGNKTGIKVNDFILDYLKSLTKESQPKGKIVIECEMEDIPDLQSYKEDSKACANVSVIKLDKDGQPILTFK